MSDQFKVLRIAEIIPAKIEVCTTLKKRSQGKTVKVLYNSRPFIFQTPYLEAKDHIERASVPNLINLDTWFRGDTVSKITNWFKMIEIIEDAIIEQVSEKGSTWFADGSINIKSLIREENEKPYFRWTFSPDEGIIVDEDGNSVDPAWINKQDKLKIIAEISDLWTNAKAFGIVIVVRKVMIKKNVPKPKSEYTFEHSDENSSSDYFENKNNIISVLATEQNPNQFKKVLDNVPQKEPSPVDIEQKSVIAAAFKKTRPRDVLPYTGIHIDGAKRKTITPPKPRTISNIASDEIASDKLISD